MPPTGSICPHRTRSRRSPHATPASSPSRTEPWPCTSVTPGRVRPGISCRSNSATGPKMAKTKRPAAMVVSIGALWLASTRGATPGQPSTNRAGGAVARRPVRRRGEPDAGDRFKQTAERPAGAEPVRRAVCEQPAAGCPPTRCCRRRAAAATTTNTSARDNNTRGEDGRQTDEGACRGRRAPARHGEGARDGAEEGNGGGWTSWPRSRPTSRRRASWPQGWPRGTNAGPRPSGARRPMSRRSMSRRGTRWRCSEHPHHGDPSYPLAEAITAERVTGLSRVCRRLMGLLRLLLSPGGYPQRTASSSPLHTDGAGTRFPSRGGEDTSRPAVLGDVGTAASGSGGEKLNPGRLREGRGGPGAYSASAVRPAEGVDNWSCPAGLLGDLEASFSPERMSTYVAAAEGDRERAVKLYAWNTVVSAAFYEPLGVGRPQLSWTRIRGESECRRR